MAQPITAVYVRDEEDYTVTVAGEGQELTDKAPGIIAARDRADQLIEKIAPRDGSDEDPTVVHLLNGSAFEFTSTYMTARLSRTEAEQDESADGDETGDATAEGAAEAAESGEVAEAEAADADAEESETVASEDVAETDAEEDVVGEGDAAETAATADEAPDAEESAEVTAETADADEGTATQGTAPGSGVPRKEITKSPEVTGSATADDESDGKTYAAAAGTSATS
ncbi:hypothetical protein LY13_001109 [Prauserella aidingensis]|uniref:hypothetical protein n=1 Tax=Prauserella aidingensis TaxID=387890 RepID=UPI0020A55B8B|nr:hypothetical protein [Prauserella aidingensis]MCP2252370.1 hypothetical protein [Prauserella aidingensis]